MSDEGQLSNSGKNCNTVYRAYRVPYDYCPQAGQPEEVAIKPMDIGSFRLPGAAPKGTGRVVQVAGTVDLAAVCQNDNFCSSTDEQAEAIQRMLEND